MKSAMAGMPGNTRRWAGLIVVTIALLIESACGGGGGGSGGGSNPTGSSSGGNSNGGGTVGQVGAVVVATAAAPDGITLSTFPFLAGGTVEATPGGQLTIPATPPDSGCGGASFRVRGSDSAFHLLFVDFIADASHDQLCAYSVDPVTGAIAEAFHLPAGGSGRVVVDPVNHVVGYLNHELYSYTASGTAAQAIGFHVPAPGGANVPEVSFVNNVIWYGTTTDGLTTIQGACPFTFSAASGYTASGICSTFSTPVTPPYQDVLGRDTTNGLFMTESSVDVSSPCSGTASTTVYLYGYDVATGAFGNDSNSVAHADIGNCVQAARNPLDVSDEAGDIDWSTGLLFTIDRSSGMKVIPYSFTSSSFSSALTAVSLVGHVADPAVDARDRLLFVLTGSGSAITGLSAYPYTVAGLGAAVPNSITLENAAAPQCGNPPCIKPLLAVVH